MNFCIAGYLRIKSSPNNAIWFIKTHFLEAIKYFRLSIGAIVLFNSKFLPLRALKTLRVLKNFSYRQAPPLSPAPTVLYTIFHEKGTPFVYLLLTNGTPFKYLV